MLIKYKEDTMLSFDENINEDILSKFILGECNSSEKELVINWINEDDKNREYFDQLESIWIESGKLDPKPIMLNPEKAWSKIENHIDNDTKSKNIKVYKWLATTAACFIIGFGLIRYFSFIDNNIYKIENNLISSLIDTLPDGTIVKLNQKSSLCYSYDKDKEQRMVSMKGEIFFDVSRDSLKPFFVKMPVGFLKVKGTSFNINTKNKKETKINVTSGIVEISRKLKDNQMIDAIILVKNESGIINKKKSKAEKNKAEPDANFWHNKTIVFDNTNLAEVFKTIENCYKVDINYNNIDTSNMDLSTSFKNENIENIIKVICASFDLDYSIIDQNYTITKNENN
ncbi:MAG: FecR family protein [Marinifilaceae bacterium]|jgi:ferric-dicitrate binding protein FerR (iron transport regulator)|nr:FecR family protein [Marinifilaceae bacterium]